MSRAYKQTETTVSKSRRTFVEVEEETGEQSETLKDEEDEFSDRSEDGPGTQPQLASLVGRSNKTRYQKRKNLDYQTKNQQNRGNKDFDKQHSQKTNDTTAGKSSGFTGEVEGGNNEAGVTLKDEEDGAQKLQNESNKNPNEKQPTNKESTCQKCWKIWKIIICVLVILSTITGVVLSSLALSRKSITPTAREPTDGITDGTWSPWGDWTECSVTCSRGLQRRSRNCLQPVPSLGGRYCAEWPLEYRLCVKYRCPDEEIFLPG